MKIARIETNGEIFQAALDNGRYNIIEGTVFGLSKLTGRLIEPSQCRLLAPVQPRQIIAIGANYRKHVEECGAKIPTAPLVFFKGVNALAGPNDNIVLPAIAPNEVDYEAELAIVIGKDAKNVSEADADKYIFGYCCANDVSARDCQIKIDSQWARGKSFDTFCPVGPYITPRLNGDNLEIKLTLNGKVMQKSNTRDMIFNCRYIVSYLSRCMTLYAGSIILTGTPSGVGMGREPNVYLRDGDEVCVEIEGIGAICNKVVSERI